MHISLGICFVMRLGLCSAGGAGGGNHALRSSLFVMHKYCGAWTHRNGGILGKLVGTARGFRGLCNGAGNEQHGYSQ